MSEPEIFSETIYKDVMRAFKKEIPYIVLYNQFNKAFKQAKFDYVISLMKKNIPDAEISRKTGINPSSISTITSEYWNDKMQNV